MDDRRSDVTDVVVSTAEISMPIDARLQARATPFGVGNRLGSVHSIEWMRAHQLSLDDRLEDMMAWPVASLIVPPDHPAERVRQFTLRW